MGAFKLRAHRGTLAPPPPPPAGTAIRTGLNFDMLGWSSWAFQDRFKSAGAWQAIPISGSTIGLPVANMDADYWPKSVPSGYKYVAHPVTHTPSTNLSGSYLVSWTGNMGGTSHAPVNNGATTVSSVNLTAKTCVITPTNPSSGVPMFIQYELDAADVSAGTYAKNITATPVGETVTTFDAAVKSKLMAVVSGGPLRALKPTGVEENGGPGSDGLWGGAWGGGTQTAPFYKVTMANRATLTSGVWAARDDSVPNNSSVARSGMPIEAFVALLNFYGVNGWWNEHWNAEPAVWSYNATYIRDHLNSGLTIYVEVANEVWNPHYDVTGQAGAEADPANRTDGQDLRSAISYSYGDRAARYAEKLVEVFGYYDTVFASASSQPGGVKPTLKRLAAWWHTQGAGLAASLLDYTPPNSATPLKNHIDAYATSPYWNPGDIDPSMAGGQYNPARGTGPLFTNLWYDAENIAQRCAQIRAVCDARGVEYCFYEASDAEFLDADASTCMAVATSLERDPQMGQLLGFAMQRIEDATPGSAMAYYGAVGGINSRDGTFALLEDPLQDPAGAIPAPKYIAYGDYASGKRYLFDLQGQLIAKTGAAVDDVVGIVRRRLVGSTVTVSSPFKIVDSTAKLLAIAVADASAFTAAGTASCVIQETGGSPSTTRTTTLTCQITSDCFWSPKRSNPMMAISTTSGRTCQNLDTFGNDVCAIGSIARTNGYFENTAALGTDRGKVGLVGPGFANNLNMYWSDHSVCWTGDTGNVIRNGSVLASWPQWTASDDVSLYLSSTGKLYGNKNGQWYGASGTLTATQVNSDTGGLSVSTFLSFVGGSVYPACHGNAAGFGLTSRFKDADFTRTKPTGASAWV